MNFKHRDATRRALAAALFALCAPQAAVVLAQNPETQATAQAARAEELPAETPQELLVGTTRKIDDYGKIGHCDETARLDNFALTLQNEPDTKGYLLVYKGRDDMPAWWGGILKRAAQYLVDSRGIDAARIRVVDAGYREKRSTELWVVAGADPAPEPSNTVEFKLDRTKAYQWDEKGINVEFQYDSAENEPQGEEAEESEEAEGDGEGEAAASDEAGAEDPPAAADGGESEDEAESDEAIEKYEIAVERRGPIEEEEAAYIDRSVEAAGGTGDSGTDSTEADAAPVIGQVKVSLWWNVENFVKELKSVPDARACLVYYHGLKNADAQTVRELVSRALSKMEEQFGFRRESVITIDGGYSPEPSVELWVVPRGAPLPKPTVDKKRNFGFYSAPAEE